MWLYPTSKRQIVNRTKRLKIWRTLILFVEKPSEKKQTMVLRRSSDIDFATVQFIWRGYIFGLRTYTTCTIRKKWCPTTLSPLLSLPLFLSVSHYPHGSWYFEMSRSQFRLNTFCVLIEHHSNMYGACISLSTINAEKARTREKYSKYACDQSNDLFFFPFHLSIVLMCVC